MVRNQDTAVPRPEYPLPQFVRKGWMNLNGRWQFEIDNARSGEARGLSKDGTALSGTIMVPFCPESRLSGVEHTDFMYGLWYKRKVTLDRADYEQDPAVFKANYDRLMTDGDLYDRCKKRQTYGGQPVFVSEYGGIRWAAEEQDGWGYGEDAAGEEGFFRRYKALADALLDNRRIFGLCYTQLTDVEQEQNGLYTYHRRPKFDVQRLYAIMSRKAAVEK